MRRQLLKLLLLLPIVVLLMGAKELRDPDPVAVPQGLSSQDVVRAIKMALVGRTWVVSKVQPGRIDATLNLRAHVARIAITYDASQVTVAYVSSDNLDYKEKKGRRYIHKNYLSWVNNVVADLSRNLQGLSME